MSVGRYFLYLALTLIINSAIFFISHFGSQNIDFYIGIDLTLLFFTIFSTSLFFLCLFSASSKNIYLFSRIFIASIIFKMILTVLVTLILIKRLGLLPEQIIFPIILIYISFTILETYSLMKISKSDKS